MTNSLSEDIYALGELMATNLNTQGVVSADADDGLTSLAGKILEINASGTSLTIEVPLNLVYSDDFNITGTLTDGNNDAISGATIKLKVGNTVVDTDTTDNNGEVSFTQSPVSMGNHSFQLVFEGDSTHPPAISSVVTREIGKETSAITMSAPAASSSYYSDASISVSGTLKTDDNEAISGASILVKLGATTLTTLTTGNDGGFSGSVSAGDLSTGSNTLKFEFAGDSYYSATYQEVAVTVNAATLVLTSDKSVLSYADSDSCVLTATYTGSTVAGHTVKLYDASDDSEVATMVDNGDGTYSATYVSQGVGDIGFYAVSGNFVSEIFAIEDIAYYNSGDHITGLVNPSSADVSTNGTYITITTNTNGEKWVYPSLDFTTNDNFSIEAEYGGVGTTQFLTLFIKDPSYNYAYVVFNDSGVYGRIFNNSGNISKSMTPQAGDKLKLEHNNGTTTIYVNDVSLYSKSGSYGSGTFHLGFYTNNGRVQTIKNIKIRRL